MAPDLPTPARPLLDLSRTDDARTAQRLTDELVVWFGSTRPDGRPHHVAHLIPEFSNKYPGPLGGMGFSAWRATFTEPVLVLVTRVIAWTRTRGQLAYRSVP